MKNLPTIVNHSTTALKGQGGLFLVHRMFIRLGLNKKRESVTISFRFVRKDRFTDMGMIQKVFGTHSERELKRIMPLVDQIEELRPSMMELTDEALREKTNEYKKRIQQDGESLDSVLPEAFATVREAARRVLNMEHYRVQLIGGIVMHQGRIAEMRTGEGKTLVATLPSYLNEMECKGFEVVSVNDFIA